MRDPTESEIRRVFAWIESQSKEKGFMCVSFRPPEGQVSSRSSENQLHWERSDGETMADAALDRFGPLAPIGSDLI